MTVSKRTRFEVLRRDGYACRYCHATDVPLVVDHVLAVALGGSDDSSNLVAACKSCNIGKSSTAPDQQVIADVDEDALRWASARTRALARLAEKRAADADRRVPFRDYWLTWDKDGSALPPDWRTSVDQWLDEGITIEQLIEAVNITLPKRHVRHDDVFRYVGGIIRVWLRELDSLTEQEIAAAEAVDGQE